MSITWNDILYKPSISAVGSSGKFIDILSTPTTLSGYGITNAISTSHIVNNITSVDITNWNAAFGYGRHAGLYKLSTYIPSWTELTNKPLFASVATTGSYLDLLDTPDELVASITGTLPITIISSGNTRTITIQPAFSTRDGYLLKEDWVRFNNKSDFDGQWSSILGKPEFSKVSYSGDYNDLNNVPNVLTSLPIASSTILGCVKIGTGLTIDSNGVLNSSSGGGSGAGTWGSILGDIADQTDLSLALSLMAPLSSPTFTGTVSATTIHTTTIHTTTILADHIGEHTGSHTTVFDNLITSSIGIVPDANDGAYLGTTSLGWSDLFLASGAVLNYANSNVTLTHSSGILTLNVGTLKITTPTNTATSVVTIDGTQTLTNKTLTSPNINEAVALTSTSTKLNYLTGATGTTGTTTTNIVFSASPTFTGVTTVNEITSNTRIRLAVTGADEYYFGATVDEFVLKNNTDGTYPLRISSDATTNNVVLKGANVGIGTATPSSKLSINGGLHVGGDSDAGDNNVLIDGTLGVTGISTFTGLIKTVGGIHVGGTSDPGIDNILVDGTISAGATTVSAKIHSLATTEQLRLGYDDAKYTSFTTDTNGDLTIAATGNDILIPHTDTICSADWVSRTTGWGIYHMADGRSGGADFRYLSVDEMHAKRFVADLEQALAGAQIISKSVAILHADVVIPAKGASVQIEVEDLPGSIANVFANNDWIQLRLFNRDDDGSFIIANAWGRVTFIDHHAATGDEPGYQHYTFSRSAIDTGTASGETVLKGAIILDFGVTGDGYIETTAIDAAGSPYQQIVTWTDHPWNTTVRTRVGQLDGISGIGDEWGFFAGSVTDKKYLLASDTNFQLHGIDIMLYDGATNTVKLDHTGLSFAMGAALPTGFLVGDGIWMGKDTAYKMRVGTVSAGALVKGFKWDGTDFTIIGNVTATTGTIGGFTLSATALYAGTGATRVQLDTSAGIHLGATAFADAPFSVTRAGVLKATSATIGGWTVNSTSIYTGTEDHSGYTANAGDITFYSNGSDASVHAKNFYIDTSGNLTATNATLSGAITATSGKIGNWNINSTSLYTGTEDHSGYTTNAGDITFYSSGSVASIHAKNFYIDATGNITAQGGTIGGWTLASDALYTGTKYVTGGYPYTTAGISLLSDGSFHSSKFYIDATTGAVGILTSQPHWIPKVASNTVRNTLSNEVTTDSKDYREMLTMYLPNGLKGTVRVMFDIKSSDGNIVYAKLLRNSTTLVGAEQSTTSTSYGTKTQDITQDWNPGDKIGIWGKVSATSPTLSIRYLLLLYDNGAEDVAVEGTLNFPK